MREQTVGRLGGWTVGGMDDWTVGRPEPVSTASRIPTAQPPTAQRPNIDIVIPVQRESSRLEQVVSLLKQNTTGFRLHIVKEPGLNVSEARQKAMDEVVKNDLVCFIDDDSEMVTPGWLDEMYQALAANKQAGAVFGAEVWGTEKAPIQNSRQLEEVEYGPAACMLLDRRRLPANMAWDANIGLKSGWLGGDFEEVDYCMRLSRVHGMKLLRAPKAVFHHTGGKTTMRDFMRTDRFKTVNVMKMLLDYKYAKAPDDDDWFHGLKYIKASTRDDCMLGPGVTLRDCYREVIRRNGLTHVRSFRKWGLV